MSSFVNISEAASLAIHAVAYIAHHPNRRISVQEIAEALDSNVHHLAKVMQRLSKHKILRSVRGPSGGFTLLRDAASTSLYDIYACIEGEIDEPDCPLNRPKCPFQKCLIDDVVQQSNRDLKAYLQSHTLDKYLRT